MLYILHFDQPFHHARHYVGYTESAESLPGRLETHRQGQGAKLLAALRKANISWKLATTMEGDRTEERRIKNQKHTARYCPICQAEGK